MTSTTPTPAPPPPHRHPPVGRVILAVLGTLLIVMALGIGIAGLALAVPYAIGRDDSGYLNTATIALNSATYAISTDRIDLGGPRSARRGAVELGDLATVRLRVEPRGTGAVFVGIGPQDDVERYLATMAHAQVTDIDLDPVAVTYRYGGSGAPASPPAAQGFWTTRAVGTGTQTIDWEPERGRWVAVIMNADGSAGVDVGARAGIKADWLVPVGVGLVAGAVLLLLAGAALLVAGIMGLGHHLHGAPTKASGAYPLALNGRLEPLNRLLWLVKPLLAIPHFVVLGFLWLAFAVLTFVAGVAILFTGRYPRPLFDFNLGVLRWTWRVGFYCFAAFGTDRYPPFTLGPAPEYPATLDVAYPDRLSRGLVLVKWWLLAIPQYVIVGIIAGGTTWIVTSGGRYAVNSPGLLGWLLLIALVGLLFTGTYPRGIFDLAMGLNRWIFRVLAYAALMTDAYPPFRLDQGDDEPLTERTTDDSAGEEP